MAATLKDYAQALDVASAMNDLKDPAKLATMSPEQILNSAKTLAGGMNNPVVQNNVTGAAKAFITQIGGMAGSVVPGSPQAAEMMTRVADAIKGFAQQPMVLPALEQGRDALGAVMEPVVNNSRVQDAVKTGNTLATGFLQKIGELASAAPSMFGGALESIKNTVTQTLSQAPQAVSTVTAAVGSVDFTKISGLADVKKQFESYMGVSTEEIASQTQDQVSNALTSAKDAAMKKAQEAAAMLGF